MQEPRSCGRARKKAAAARDRCQVYPLSLLRTPLCSYLRFLELSDAALHPQSLEGIQNLAQARAVIHFFQDPLIRRALKAKSTSLYEALQRYEQGQTPLDDATFTALARYLARITTRCTPLMLFAGVGWARVDAQDVVHQDPPSTWSVGVFPSHRIMAGVTRDALSDPRIREHLRFRLTETALRRGGVLCHFTVEAPQDGAELPQQKFVCLRLDAQLLPLLSDPLRSWTWTELVQQLQRECPDASMQMIEEYLASMCEVGLLIDSLQPPSLGRRPEQYLYDQAQAHPDLAVLLSECSSMLEFTQAPHALAAPDFPNWWEKLEQHPWAASHRAGVAHHGGAARGSAFQAVLQINGSQGSIPAALVGDLGRLIQSCPGLWSHRQRHYRHAIAEFFAEGAVAARIPFLDLVYRVVKTPHFADVPQADGYTGRTQKLRPDPACDSLEQRLFEAERIGAAQVDLSSAELQAMAVRHALSAALPSPPVVESLFQLIRRGGRAGLVHRHTTSLIGAYECRFLNWDPEHPVLLQLRNIWQLQQQLAAPALLAEVTATGPGYVKDLGQRPESYAYQIVLCGEASVPSAQQIPVHELSVDMGPSGPRLWWERRGVQIIPRQHSSLNVLSYPAVVHMLLALDPYPTDWALPGLPQHLPMRCARICHGDIVLRAQTWTLPPTLQSELKQAGRRQRQQLQRIQSLITAWRERYQVPRYVRLGDADHNVVDLEQPLAIAELTDMLQDGLSFVCEEFLDEPSPVLGSQGPLLAEATAHIRLAEEARGEPAEVLLPPLAQATQGNTVLAPARPPREPELRQDHVFYPGGAWLYLKLYHGSGLGSEAATRHFIDENLLGRLLAPMLFELEQERVITNYHFVRYSDPDAHLRLRMQAADGRGLALLDRISERLWQEARNGAFASYQICTYEREVDRYGGPDVIEAAERLFTADSRLCLSILSAYHADLLDEETELQRLLPIRTLDTLFVAFEFALADELAAVSQMRTSLQPQRRLTEAEQRQLDGRYRNLRRVIQGQIRHLEGRPLGTSPQPLSEGAQAAADAAWLAREDVSAWYARYRADVHEAAAIYRSAQKQGRLQTALSEVLPVLFHMHCNRLLGSPDLEFETVYLCQRALEAVQAQIKYRPPT